MSVSFSSTSLPFSASSFAFQRPQLCFNPLTVASDNFHSATCGRRLVLDAGGTSLCRRFRGFKLWVLERLNFQFKSPKQPKNRNRFKNNLENSGLSNEKGSISDSSSILHVPDDKVTSMEFPSLLQTGLAATPMDVSRIPSLCIAVIGATGELAKSKIFPALFALYYSGFLPENVGIFGYSRKDITDEDLRSIIASTLTCRVEHHHQLGKLLARENCGDKLDAFLSRTYYVNGGYDNKYGMSMLNARMEQIELIIYHREDPKPTGYSTFQCHKKQF
ncbi:unnamed protein product [Sphenostylis stenocarpa]|uniref:Glucose-6-phosphate dehydrogenase NAD-binding domain-containing protein n=1 Tax=Sphenostylis stenocarpa TaxID=92480 RepID=A0AA86S350_9FABA|nr:unnamed protein product [Sphenostylis stenocarpa]